jgi:hypothetical protein
VPITDSHDITEILLKVALNTINHLNIAFLKPFEYDNENKKLQIDKKKTH